MVNTFLTDADFATSAKKLDDKRLNSQCNEALIILRYLDWVDAVAHFYDLAIPVVTDVREDKEMVREFLHDLFHRARWDANLPKELFKKHHGYLYHPAVRMWLGYGDALQSYLQAHQKEWLARGFNRAPVDLPDLPDEFARPPWTNDPKWHRSHQLALLNKAPHHYSQFWEQGTDVFEGYLW